MREILFRGKRKDYGTWVEGYYVHNFWNDGEDTIHLVDGGCCTVMPETVCQYTGLKDEYGNKIWENDILTFPAYGEKYKGDVKFVGGNFIIQCGKCSPFLDDVLEKHSATVIGNIFDNPDLRKI